MRHFRWRISPSSVVPQSFDNHATMLCVVACLFARQVQFDEAHQYSEDNGLIHMETSAKSALNVKNIFVEIGECQSRRKVA